MTLYGKALDMETPSLRQGKTGRVASKILRYQIYYQVSDILSGIGYTIIVLLAIIISYMRSRCHMMYMYD